MTFFHSHKNFAAKLIDYMLFSLIFVTFKKITFYENPGISQRVLGVARFPRSHVLLVITALV